MKIFADLKFDAHRMSPAKHAILFFPNGYGVSVVGGAYGLYGDGVNDFEVAIVRGTDEEYAICDDTGIIDGVLGYQSIDEVSGLMIKIQKL